MLRGWGRDRLLSRWCEEKQVTVGKIIKLDPCLTPHTKELFRCIKGLRVSCQTINLEGNVRKYFCDLRYKRTSKYWKHNTEEKKLMDLILSRLKLPLQYRTP